jgi:hypothetical protein
MSQSVQGTAGSIPQLGYEWFHLPYGSNVELNSILPFPYARSFIELKIMRYLTVVDVGLSPTPVIQ